jgi:hypothetical protein
VNRWANCTGSARTSTYLKASGASADYHRALFAYNHAE